MDKVHIVEDANKEYVLCGKDLVNFYEYTAHQIDREDKLINFRLTWNLIVQGFLFSSFGYILSNLQNHPYLFYLLILISIIGVLVSLAGFIGIHAALLAIKDLKDGWQPYIGIKKFPRPSGRKKAHQLGKGSVYSLPIIFGIVWIIIMINSNHLSNICF